jgi:hypothetical protein
MTTYLITKIVGTEPTHWWVQTVISFELLYRCSWEAETDRQTDRQEGKEQRDAEPQRYVALSSTEYPVLYIKTKLHGLSPLANYTDRATAACRQSDCQLLRIEGATWSA